MLQGSVDALLGGDDRAVGVREEVSQLAVERRRDDMDTPQSARTPGHRVEHVSSTSEHGQVRLAINSTPGSLSRGVCGPEVDGMHLLSAERVWRYGPSALLR